MNLDELCLKIRKGLQRLIAVLLSLLTERCGAEALNLWDNWYYVGTNSMTTLWLYFVIVRVHTEMKYDVIIASKVSGNVMSWV